MKAFIVFSESSSVTFYSVNAEFQHFLQKRLVETGAISGDEVEHSLHDCITGKSYFIDIGIIIIGVIIRFIIITTIIIKIILCEDCVKASMQLVRQSFHSARIIMIIMRWTRR